VWLLRALKSEWIERSALILLIMIIITSLPISSIRASLTLTQTSRSISITDRKAVSPKIGLSMPSKRGIAPTFVKPHTRAVVYSAAVANYDLDDGCPRGWQCAQIGDPNVTGGQEGASNTWAISGTGGMPDNVRFIWQSIGKEGGVSARVVSQPVVGSADLGAGVMIRDGRQPGAAAYSFYATTGHQFVVRVRGAQGQGETFAARVLDDPPAYLRVARAGDTFTAFTSHDGHTWHAVHNSSIAIHMGRRVEAGVAVALGQPGTAVFHHVAADASSTSGPLATPLTPSGGVGSSFSDHPSSIYGLSGTFAADDVSGCGITECNGATKVSTVADSLHGSYIRFPVMLSCQRKQGPSWWNSLTASPGNEGSFADLLRSARSHNLTPIINLVPPGNCAPLIGPGSWYKQARDLVNSEAGLIPPTVYFEIGNEENLNVGLYNGTDHARNPSDNYRKYAAIFASAARGLNEALSRHHVRNYRILTGGMLRPTATDDRHRCPASKPPYTWASYTTNYEEAQMAVEAAENPTGPHIPASHLGLAVHPYGYATPSTADWPNYYALASASYNPCSDLQGMLDHWTRGPYFKGLPIVFTETNFADTNNTLDSRDPHSRDPLLTDKEAAYLVDSFTWLGRHPTQEHNYAGSTGSPAVIVLWFRGNNVPGAGSGQSLGLYGSANGGGADKYPIYPISHCPNTPFVQGKHPLSYYFVALQHAGCENPLVLHHPRASASITLSPTHVYAGRRISVMGTHFAKSTTIILLLYPCRPQQCARGRRPTTGKMLGRVKAASNGTFHTVVTVPAGSKSKTYYIVALVKGREVAIAPVIVHAASGTNTNPTNAIPHITSVRFSSAGSRLHIVVSGSGFGHSPKRMPYSGNTCCFYFFDRTKNWAGGQGHVGVVVKYKSWDDTRIVVDGFAGSYGQENWFAGSRDKVEIGVINPDTHNFTSWHGVLPVVAPRIVSIRFSDMGLHLHIIVSGSGFGPSPTRMPYSGNTCCFYFYDHTRKWLGGQGHVGVGLKYRSWSDTQIVVDGFSGSYGQEGWFASSHDDVEIGVTNPDTGDSTSWRRPLPTPPPHIASAQFSGQGVSLRIVVSGSGFGPPPAKMPYIGDTCCFDFYDHTKGWAGGQGHEGVGLKYRSWSNTHIVINGFVGGYGQGGWVAATGDDVEIDVTNPSTDDPASWRGILP